MVWGTAAPAAPTVAWATQAEEDEGAPPPPKSLPVLGAKESAFPTLGAAVKVKKTKKQTMSLADFNLGASPGGGYRAPGGSRGPDDSNLVLPTGPRAREEGEDDSRPGLGGAFRDYGGDRGGVERESKYGAREPYGDRDGPRRGGGFDDEDGRPPREDAGPSRADEDRDWGASKKFVPTGPSERRDERPSERDGGGGFGDGPSRADGDRNWGASKSFVPSTDGPRGDDRGGSRFGGGSFGGERRGESDGDRWARPGAAEGAGPTERPRLQLKQRSGDAPLASASGEAKASVFGGATPVQVKQLDDEPRAAPTPGRPAAPADSDKWERRGPAPAPGGSESASRPSERPKLQLAPRAAGAPTAATDAASLAETRGGVFGDAKPRELKLAQEGRDWRVEDALLSASGVKRDDTPEEAELRAKLAEAAAAAAAPEASAEAKAKANELELSLAKLTLSINDKRRFAGAGGGKLAEDKGWRKAPPAEAAPK